MANGSARGRSPNLVDSMFEAASDLAQSARGFLASEQGKRLRHNVATAVILGAPIISELPLVRRTPVARILRTAAVGALLVKGAEWLRDWDPVSVVEVPAEYRSS
jgi:hypothetical protein